MKSFIGTLVVVICCALLSVGTAHAQFNTPTIDGTISPGEYGNHTNGQNQQTNGGQVWYLSWDNTNLYVAVTNANLADGSVVAIDHNPVSPPNGGTNADGTLNALNYDSTAIGNFPFRADSRSYFKDGYRDYNTANGANGWNFGASGFGAYASGAGNVREFSIPWATITGGGRPSSFLFLGYLSSGGGSIYGQVPSGNAGGTTPGNWSRYFAVINTNNGTSTPPFSLDRPLTTTANVSIGGHVSDSSGKGLGRVRVSLTDSAGNVRTVWTNSFGVYRFDEVSAGTSYVVFVSSRRYQFENPSRVLNVNESRDDIDFVGNESK